MHVLTNFEEISAHTSIFMQYEIKKDRKFEYIEEGEGPVIILLHGLFGALSNWVDVVEHFRKDHKVVIPLMPIFTMPPLPNILQLTLVGQLARFINKFIKLKGYENYTLVGNSLGGHVALVYCTKHPENVKRLVLTASSGLYENSMGNSFPKREDYSFIQQKVAATFYDPKHGTKELVDECYEIVNNRLKLVRILGLAKAAIRHNMAKEIPDISMPTCLIWGKNDTITPPEVAEEFLSLLPNAELHWIDKCGHAPMMEQPQEFNRILSDWLKRNE